jgi:sugar phosphate isomerase/epimerase
LGHACTAARKANVKQAIEAVFMSAPMFVVSTWAPALEMFHAIDDTWRLQA